VQMGSTREKIAGAYAVVIGAFGLPSSRTLAPTTRALVSQRVSLAASARTVARSPFVFGSWRIFFSSVPNSDGTQKYKLTQAKTRYGLSDCVRPHYLPAMQAAIACAMAAAAPVTMWAS
jgi:hypothetical protein